jgi:hypothetical protein
MTANRKARRQGKRVLYFEDAQSLFLAGKDLEEIAGPLPVPLQTLERWHIGGQWEEKRRQVPVSPRWLGEALKGILREKAGNLLVKVDLKPQELDEITKIVTLIDRLCRQGLDIRVAALEVMDRSPTSSGAGWRSRRNCSASPLGWASSSGNWKPMVGKRNYFRGIG